MPPEPTQSDRIAFARTLRTQATPEERALWRALSQVRPRFTRQLKLDPYVADFACRRARLIVEVDGSQHVGNMSDERRTAYLTTRGWRIVRFWNSDVRANYTGVVEAILEAVNQRLPPGENAAFVPRRAGRLRQPRTRKREEEPPPAPPARSGGE